MRKEIIEVIFETILAALFPPRLPKLDEYRGDPKSLDPFVQPVTECGVLWRAYDVRQTGIEKHFRRLYD